jgi:caffeoyl-CoA O-methyltransferase
MSSRTLTMTDALHGYLTGPVSREPAILRELREETSSLSAAGMQISPEQGQFMQLLLRVLGAKKTLEIGVFTGYSSLATALALPPDGRIVACDVSEEWTSMARRYWARAGVADRIDLRIAPATETLDGLIRDGQAGQYDFAFIDADKDAYDAYYERCLTLLRPGGLVAVDNALWSGRVADLSENDPDTAALRALNAKMRDDERVDFSLVPIGDGLALARKRG